MGAAGVARQPLAKTCILLLAGGLAAQHTTLLLTYDALCLCLVASILALAKPRLRAFALPALGWTLFMVSGVAIVEGQWKVRAERVGNASMLGQMIDIMERGLGRKTPLEGRTDLILKWFTPLILLLALGVVMCTWLGDGPPPVNNTEADEAMPALQAQ